jgi:ferrous iron transport protein A
MFGKRKRRMHAGHRRHGQAHRGMTGTATISDLPCGAFGIISDIHVEGPVRQRLMDLGIIKGARVEMIRCAPLGDPVQIKVRGTLIALRKKEADMLHIEPSGDSLEGPHTPRRCAGG